MCDTQTLPTAASDFEAVRFALYFLLKPPQRQIVQR
jgi:hypothetical protein